MKHKEQNISLHIVNILKYNKLQENSVVKNYLTTAKDSKEYKVIFYALDMVKGFVNIPQRGNTFVDNCKKQIISTIGAIQLT